MFVVCMSLVSLRCCEAMVEVLKRIRSRRFSAFTSGWEFSVSTSIALIFVMKEGSWYREFFTFVYPFPVLNLLMFMERVTTLWSVSKGGGECMWYW